MLSIVALHAIDIFCFLIFIIAGVCIVGACFVRLPSQSSPASCSKGWLQKKGGNVRVALGEIRSPLSKRKSLRT